MDSPASYQQALAAERQAYANCLEVHELPPAFHYWSNRHLLPKLQAHGFDSPDGLFLKTLREQCERNVSNRFISIGAGNGDLELKLAKELRAKGYRDFIIECLDLNEDMLERGRRAAEAASLSANLSFQQGDFNEWHADGAYDAILANQSLHHVINLEGLFTEIGTALKPSGAFVISDMIGRNGHLRWPEALQIVHEFWRQLPPTYRFNQKLGTYEEMFQDWDCSAEGFEGVRSQDILRLLLEHFHFQTFVPFGNLIDPFVDRAFGHHFDVDAQWDRYFLDRVHQRDEEEMSAGRLTPTHLLAVMTIVPQPGTVDPTWVRRFVRTPERVHELPSMNAIAAYDWRAFPHPIVEQLEAVCGRLADSENGQALRDRTLWAQSLQAELLEVTAHARRWENESTERTAWARELEQVAVERTEWASQVDEQLEQRTAWAISLHEDLQKHAVLLTQLRSELEERTAWAQQLDQQLMEQIEWNSRLQAEIAEQRISIEYLRKQPLRNLVKRWVGR